VIGRFLQKGDIGDDDQRSGLDYQQCVERCDQHHQQDQRDRIDHQQAERRIGHRQRGVGR
jgi:hypothetical protein